MKNYSIIAIIAACLFCVMQQPAEARIGETLAQCAKRYGKPRSHEDNWYTFKKNNVEILAMFNANKVVESILFTMDGGFNAAQLKALVVANCGHKEWKEASNGSSDIKESVVSSDGKFFVCERYSGDLLIFTEEAMKTSKRKAQNTVEGF